MPPIYHWTQAAPTGLNNKLRYSNVIQLLLISRLLIFYCNEWDCETLDQRTIIVQLKK